MIGENDGEFIVRHALSAEKKGCEDKSMEPMRLNKYLAQCGVCSRRDADHLIERGKVTVNGQTASLGALVTDVDTVVVNGKPLKGVAETRKVVLAFYKPAGVICTERDRHAEKVLSDLVQYPIRVTYAGRLDKDSEGLLLLTNDGDLIEAMMRGSHCHEKEYIVKVNKELTQEFLKGLAEGVYLPDLDCTTRPCRVEPTGKFTFRIVLTQGLNRQIRRMCEAFGYHTRKLQRVRVVNIRLDGIPYGKYREVTGKELEELYRAVGLKAPEQGDSKQDKPAQDKLEQTAPKRDKPTQNKSEQTASKRNRPVQNRSEQGRPAQTGQRKYKLAQDKSAPYRSEVRRHRTGGREA